MGTDVAGRRRWIGGAALAGAVAMLVVGETVLKGSLGDFMLLAYWLICLGLTGVAVLMAFLDVRVLHHRTRREQHDLFEATLKEIVSDAERKSHRAPPPKPGTGRK